MRRTITRATFTSWSKRVANTFSLLPPPPPPPPRFCCCCGCCFPPLFFGDCCFAAADDSPVNFARCSSICDSSSLIRLTSRLASTLRSSISFCIDCIIINTCARRQYFCTTTAASANAASSNNALSRSLRNAATTRLARILRRNFIASAWMRSANTVTRATLWRSSLVRWALVLRKTLVVPTTQQSPSMSCSAVTVSRISLQASASLVSLDCLRSVRPSTKI
mmetsp:Transcript_5316/g.8696  ORF Transcript_5316/g.8696 Transcript_5316/m.8696 type:complete len:222 (-) Transcript_5316:1096-1761(-)